MESKKCENCILRTTICTWCLVILQGNHILGALLETLQEINDEIPDVLSVGGLECELLIPDSDEGEGLGESFAAPIIMSRLILITTTNLFSSSTTTTIS